MFIELDQKQKFINCPRCESTNTLLSAFNNKSYCANCRKLYDKTDETRLRKELMTSLKEKDFNMQEFELIFSEYQDLFYKKTCGLFNPSNADIAQGRLIHLM